MKALETPLRVNVKIFPIAGLCEQRQDIELVLEEGSMNELEMLLFRKLNVNPGNVEAYMFLHNGRGLCSSPDKYKDVVFQNGDQLWLLPQISGG